MFDREEHIHKASHHQLSNQTLEYNTDKVITLCKLIDYF